MADNEVNEEVDVAEGVNQDDGDNPKPLSSILAMMRESLPDVGSATQTKSNKEKRKHEVSKRDQHNTDDDDDDDDYDEDYDEDYYYSREDMKPDRSKTDYYCKICQAHMNSEEMWEAHISGKRHLKNIQKHPGEMPSKVRSIKINARAKLLDSIKKVVDPVVGLGFMTELQRYDQGLRPLYTCHLCQANCTSSVVIDHILTTKHRLAYIKAVDPERYEVLENMDINNICLDYLTEEQARQYEEKRGCGEIEVKLEKPKMAPPPPRELTDYETSSAKSRSLSSHKAIKSSRHRSRSRTSQRSKPYHVPSYRHSRASSEEESRRNASSLLLSTIGTSKLSTMEKIKLMKMLIEDIRPIPSSSIDDIPTIITDLSTTILQYKIRQLPQSVQNKVARHIARQETRKFYSQIMPYIENIFDGIHSISLNINCH